MTLIRINHHPTGRQLAVFGFAWAVVFGVVGRIVWRDAGSIEAAAVVWVLAVAVPAAGWVWPSAMRAVFIATSYATMPIGLVLSYLVLAVVYYGLLTPIGLAMRACGRDVMHRRFDREAETYWRPRKQDDRPSRYFRQF